MPKSKAIDLMTAQQPSYVPDIALSIVIPCYRSSQSLPLLMERLNATLPGLVGAGKFEVIAVNDGSPDTTWKTIDDLTTRYDWLIGIDLMRNYGQHNALLRGILQARGSVIVTMDDDLQHPPEELPKMLAKLEEGYDVVYGKPMAMKHNLWRRLSSEITKVVLQQGMGVESARHISAFRAFRSIVRDAFSDYRGTHVNLDVLLTWGTSRFVVADVAHHNRQFGKSNYTLYKLIVHTVNLITGFSVLPLQMGSLLGFALTLVGIVLLFYVLIGYAIQGSPVQGFPFLASVMVIFSGVQLFVLGIMGEYLARIHIRSTNRPSSTVRQMKGSMIREK
jgi:glycosyltransferase involved in cell wall biosynthesis